MTIRVSRPAPSFEAGAYLRGEAEPLRVSLADYRGTWVVLFFYPRDFTFVCPTELQAFARLEPQFGEENAVVLGASTDSFECHKAWYETDPRLRDVAFPVIADTSHQVSDAYGVLLDDGRALRGTFIIDPEGTLRHVSVNDTDVGRDPDETLRTLRALRTGALCPASWRPGEATLTVTLPGVAA